MSKFITAICMTLALFSTPAFAGGGHDHGHSHGPVKAEVAVQKAKDKIAALVKSEKIAASWGAIEPESVVQKTYSKGPEWLVTFKNIKEKDASKQTLYMFYSLDGHYIAANYTGN